MDNPLRAIVRYFVTKRLSGDVITLLSVKEYLVDQRSPSEIGHKYRISKYKVRGYVQRVVEKAGSQRLATAVVERTWRLIYQIQPIVIRAGGRWVCLLCNEEVARPEAHVRKQHKKEIEEAVNQVISKLQASRKTRK